MRLFRVVTLAVLAVSCSKGGGSSPATAPAPAPAPTAPADATVKSDTGGVLTATVDPTKPQKVSASATGALKGTTITFPAGALAVATDVTLQEGAPLAIDSLKSALKIDAGTAIVAASGTMLLSVPSGSSADLAKPATVSLPYAPPASLLGATKPALLYQITCGAAPGKTLVGIDSGTDVKIVDGKAQFDIKCLSGAYSIVMVPADFGMSQAVAADLPPPVAVGQVPATATASSTTVATSTSVAAINLVAHTPADATTSLPATVTMTFDAAIDETSAMAAISVENVGSPGDVPGSITTTDKVVTFTPTTSFTLGSAYHVAIKSHLAGAGGGKLAGDTGFDFTVNDGAWTAVPSLAGMTSPDNPAFIVPLGGDSFGAAVIGSAKPIVNLTVFDGTQWSTPDPHTFTNLNGFTAAGGGDGSFYVIPSLGLSNTAITPTLHRVQPTLASDLPLVSTAANYSSVESVPFGAGGALFVFLNGTDYSVTARTIAGDTLGNVETVAASPPVNTFRSNVSLAGNADGIAAVAFNEYFNMQNHTRVLLRAKDGSWTSLTPAGTEVGTVNTYQVDVGIDSAGNVSAFWCLANKCAVKTYNGSAWGNEVDVTPPAGTISSFILVSNSSMDRFMAIWGRMTSMPTNFFLDAAVYQGGAWGAVKTLDTDTQSIGYFVGGMDVAGRATVAWSKGTAVSAARLSGTTWGDTASLGTKPQFNYLYMGVDPSGTAMVGWENSGAWDTSVFH